jgi:hypothetical protein
MCLVYRRFISCFVLAGIAAFANGCHNASSGSTTPRLAADAATEVAGSDGSVLTGDAVASLDSSLPRSTDAATSLDSTIPRSTDAAASPDRTIPFTADVAANLDSSIPFTADVAASLDSSVPFTADAPAQDGRQGDTPAIHDGSVSPPADASRDSQTSGEWLDDAGVCRSSQIPTFTRTCQKTYQDAVTSGAPVGDTRSGWCGDMLVWISYATPSIGCGYDSTGNTLVAQYFGDDVRDRCGRSSYSVSTPNWPASCIPTPVDAGPDVR